MKHVPRHSASSLFAIRCVAAMCVLGSWMPASVANAQLAEEPLRQDSQEIRKSAGRILDSPEFRHFQRLKGRSVLPNSRLRSESGSGSGPDGRRAGDGRPDARPDGRADGGNANRSQRQRRSGTDNGDGSADSQDVTVPSFGGGGIGAAFGPLMHGIAWILLVVICGVIVYFIIRAFMDYERLPKLSDEPGSGPDEGEQEPERAPGELPADVYLAKARELAAAGRFREAVAQLLLGAMSHIERTGLIRFRRGLTYRDYQRAIRSDDRLYDSLRSMVRVYEPLGFGRREATRTHFEKSLSGYEAGFAARPAAPES